MDSGPSAFPVPYSRKKKEYYEELQKLTIGMSLDVTSWIEWFLNIVTDSIKESRAFLKRTLAVTAFMKRPDPTEFNSREMSMLYRLADGTFYGKLTTDKWMKLMKCSNTVAFRDIQHLVEKGFLIPSGEGGRSTGYFFNSNILDN